MHQRQTHQPRSLSPTSRAFFCGPSTPGIPQRIGRIIARIMSLPEDQVGVAPGRSLGRILPAASAHSQALPGTLRTSPRAAADRREVSEQRQLLIGSYFLAEYSLESAALFNPSIVPHPDQTGLPPGALRFVLSLRATGEGHISSITFRTGIIHPDHRIEVFTPAGFLTEPRQIPNRCMRRHCSDGNSRNWD